jgi:hypothetical protein
MEILDELKQLNSVMKEILAELKQITSELIDTQVAISQLPQRDGFR